MYIELTKSGNKHFLSVMADTPIGDLEATCLFHEEINESKYRGVLNLSNVIDKESFILKSQEFGNGNIEIGCFKDNIPLFDDFEGFKKYFVNKFHK